MASTFQPTLSVSNEGYVKVSGANVVTSVAAVWNRGTTALVINDVLAGPYMPAGARILNVRVRTNDCETSTGALTLDVGDATTVDRFIAADTVGRAGGITTAMVAAGVGYKYTAETQLQVKVKAAATAAGSSDPQIIILLVDYIVE